MKLRWPWQKDAGANRPQDGIKLSELESWDALFGVGAGTVAGPVVTSETAMKATAVFACVRIIAGAIASLPLEVRTQKGSQAAGDHPYHDMLNSAPSGLMSAAVFREALVSDMLLAGDGISLVDRTYGGRALGLYHVPSRAVSVERKAGRLLYNVRLEDGGYETFDQDDVLQVPCLGWKNNRGLSPIAHARETVGLALAGQEYAGRFFSNGGNIGGYLSYKNKVNSDQANEIREYWYRKHQGLENAHKPAILSEGGEYKNLTMSAEDAQLLQQREFQIVDICRIYGLPPWMVASVEKSTSWGTGIEQQFIGFVQLTLTPHLTRIEQELNRKLFRDSPYCVDFNVKGLLRGDVKTRFEGYRVARGGNQEPGFMTINEIRAQEGLRHVEGGDVLYRPATETKEGDDHAQSQ